MDADTILRIKPALTEYLHQLDGLMGRVTNRSHLNRYVSGQLSDLDRKSIEPIADAAGVPPRTLQEFLSMLVWDESGVRDEIQRQVARRHGHPDSVGIIDETSFPKQGTKTACVQRQHCGARGKMDNCVVSVHLGYAAGEFHTLLDGDLFLPEHTWDADRSRCRAAGIPDDVVYRSKWQIALEQIRRALGNGVRFAWLTFDEGYGGKPPFLRALDGLGQNYVGEIPASFVGWTRPPEILYREHGRDQGKGRPRKLPRLKVRNTPAAEVRNILAHSPVLRRIPWEKFHVKDGAKGPMVWEVKRIPLWIKDENGLPSRPHHLLIARNTLAPKEVKFFLSNAPESTSVELLLLVAFSRWRIERLFEDSKTELGMDHFEVRKYISIQRHLILTCVSHLFLAEFWLAHNDKKNGADLVPGADRHPVARSHVVSRWPLLSEAGRDHRRAIDDNTGPQRGSSTLAPKANSMSFTQDGHILDQHTALPMARSLAL
ncbi:MAG: IS701 family transposase [Phycisphaerae bacterium]|nr:IS701 family transposase [Phycisphaerae bacterium]MBP7936797.1 IS701 family transposase [Phycisphaerae bacterium]